MKLQVSDYNNAQSLFNDPLKGVWAELSSSLRALPLQLKPSDQSGKDHSPIFDPVATNAVIKHLLQQRGWATNIVIPAAFDFLGTDVDFLKKGVLVEAQFSNYPFLLNNVVRSELIAQSGTCLQDEQVTAVVIITKAHMFPSSNSTLYYEQAVKQLSALAQHGLIKSPMRLVGLFEDMDERVDAMWHEYPQRYSRSAANSTKVRCTLTRRATTNARCVVRLHSRDKLRRT
jgi:hypothetical protein